MIKYSPSKLANSIEHKYIYNSNQVPVVVRSFWQGRSVQILDPPLVICAVMFVKRLFQIRFYETFEVTFLQNSAFSNYIVHTELF